LKITPDTNILVRAAVDEDSDQTRRARACLMEAEAVVLTLPALCEFAWVLKAVYRADKTAVARALRDLTEAGNAVVDARAVQLGLRILEANGDFADGVIAAVGAEAGSDLFVSFDRQAVKLISEAGTPARLLT
jgi:predicted nucleic-acid-binding protein